MLALSYERLPELLLKLSQVQKSFLSGDNFFLMN